MIESLPNTQKTTPTTVALRPQRHKRDLQRLVKTLGGKWGWDSLVRLIAFGEVGQVAGKALDLLVPSVRLPA